MKIVHWNTSKESSQMSGIKKYEDELYRCLLNIILKYNLDIEISRILRSRNKISGSTVMSWLLRYRDNSADIVHATSQVLAPTIYTKKFKRFIITVLDLAPLVYPFEVRDISEKIQWLLTPKALKKIDKIIAISEFTKREIKRLLGIDENKITVIHLGVDHSLYKPIDKYSCKRFFGLNEDERHILYVASNLYHKRTDLAKAIFEEIRKCRDDVKLIKAGYSEKLKGKDIINVGWIHEKDMPKLYNSADVYLHTSEYEGFGLPVLEAMACGIPVVVSNRASLPEIVGNAGILVDLGGDCIQEFAEKVLKILDEKTGVDKKALERSMMFSWEKTARDTLKEYGVKI